MVMDGRYPLQICSGPIEAELCPVVPPPEVAGYPLQICSGPIEAPSCCGLPIRAKSYPLQICSGPIEAQDAAMHSAIS